MAIGENIDPAGSKRQFCLGSTMYRMICANLHDEDVMAHAQTIKSAMEVKREKYNLCNYKNLRRNCGLGCCDGGVRTQQN